MTRVSIKIKMKNILLTKLFVLNHSNEFINKNKLSIIDKLDWFGEIYISDFIVISLKIN